MRILFVVLPHSPHTVRWTRIVAETGWDVHLFPSYEVDNLLDGYSDKITVHGLQLSRRERIIRGVAPRTRLAVSRVGLRTVRLGHRLLQRNEREPGRLVQFLERKLSDRATHATSDYAAARSPEKFARVPWVVPRPPRVSETTEQLRSTDGQPDSARHEDLAAAAGIINTRANPRAHMLANLIDRVRPDIVHSLTVGQTGYLTMTARLLVPDRFPTWIVSNWGSDIHLWGRVSKYQAAIRCVLGSCDFYTAECDRDVALAREFGFRGDVPGVFPAGGGFDLAHLRSMRQPGPPSTRRLIMLKGYQGEIGRALTGLRAIERCADALQGYRIAIYLADPDVRVAAELVSRRTGIPIEIVPFQPTQDGIWRLHGQARASIGLGISDGISTSALEAMIMGSLPIQSDTSCLNEWVECGKTGFIVPAEDPRAVEATLRRAVTDDAFVDRAAEQNAEVATARLDYRIVQEQVRSMYRSIMQHVERKGTGLPTPNQRRARRG